MSPAGAEGAGAGAAGETGAATEGKSSTDYAALYEQAHPEAIPNAGQAEAAAYAAKPGMDDARVHQTLADISLSNADAALRGGVPAESTEVQVSLELAARRTERAEQARTDADTAAEAAASSYDINNPPPPTYTNGQSSQGEATRDEAHQAASADYKAGQQELGRLAPGYDESDATAQEEYAKAEAARLNRGRVGVREAMAAQRKASS